MRTLLFKGCSKVSDAVSVPQPPNTVYVGSGGLGRVSYNEVHVGSGGIATIFGSSATGFVESGGVLTVSRTAVGIVSAGATATVFSGGTVLLAGESGAT